MASAALLCVWPYHFIISGFSAFDFSPALCLDTCFVVEKSNLNPNSNLSRDKNCLYVLPTYLVLVVHAAAAAAKSLQSCPTLCNPIDGSPPGSSVPGILQARTLEWVAISFSNAWKWKMKVKSLSRVQPSATPWTTAYQAPPSRGFSRQEYWSGVPLPSPVGGPYSYIIIHILWCYGHVIGCSVWLLGVDIDRELYSGRPFTCSLVTNDIINLKKLLLEALSSCSIPEWSFLILFIPTCYLTWLEGFS